MPSDYRRRTRSRSSGRSRHSRRSRSRSRSHRRTRRRSRSVEYSRSRSRSPRSSSPNAQKESSSSSSSSSTGNGNAAAKLPGFEEFAQQFAASGLSQDQLKQRFLMLRQRQAMMASMLQQRQQQQQQQQQGMGNQVNPAQQMMLLQQQQLMAQQMAAQQGGGGMAQQQQQLLMQRQMMQMKQQLQMQQMKVQMQLAQRGMGGMAGGMNPMMAMQQQQQNAMRAPMMGQQAPNRMMGHQGPMMGGRMMPQQQQQQQRMMGGGQMPMRGGGPQQAQQQQRQSRAPPVGPPVGQHDPSMIVAQSDGNPENDTMDDGELRFYKTKFCFDWQRSGGRCARGTHCKFAHGQAELRRDCLPHNNSVTIPQIVARQAEPRYNPVKCTVPACQNPDCRSAHNMNEIKFHPRVYKSRMCNMFPNCKLGKVCSFAHHESHMPDNRKKKILAETKERRNNNKNQSANQPQPAARAIASTDVSSSVELGDVHGESESDEHLAGEPVLDRANDCFAPGGQLSPEARPQEQDVTDFMWDIACLSAQLIYRNGQLLVSLLDQLLHRTTMDHGLPLRLKEEHNGLAALLSQFPALFVVSGDEVQLKAWPQMSADDLERNQQFRSGTAPKSKQAAQISTTQTTTATTTDATTPFSTTGEDSAPLNPPEDNDTSQPSQVQPEPEVDTEAPPQDALQATIEVSSTKSSADNSPASDESAVTGSSNDQSSVDIDDQSSVDVDDIGDVDFDEMVDDIDDEDIDEMVDAVDHILQQPDL